MKLSGKIAIVTGGGGPGIGRAVCRRLAREGCQVVVSDIDEPGGLETVGRIVEVGGKANFVHADAGIQQDVRRLVSNGVDILVNNASPPYRPGGPFDYSDEILSVDLLGTMWATRFAVEVMKERGGGSIVNISSTSAIGHGWKHSGSPAYDVAKAGVLRLTTILAPFVLPHGIRVNCIAPDWVATPEVLEYWNSRSPEQRQADGAPRRLTTVEEIAEATLRLATDESLTGRVVVWWSDEEPGLIAGGDPGYRRLEDWRG